MGERLSAVELARLRDKVARARVAEHERLMREAEHRAELCEWRVRRAEIEQLRAYMAERVREAEWEAARLRVAGLVECACGCGETLTALDERGRPRRYLHGHNGKLAKRSPEEQRARKAAKDRRYRERHLERLREYDRQRYAERVAA